MSMESDNLFNLSSLSEAAYVSWENVELSIQADVEDALQNNDKGGYFSESQAEAFVDEWSVVPDVHQPDTSSGFSATVFKKNSNDKLVVALRGTNGPIDVVEADIMGISTYGAAYHQIVDMYNWWMRISSPVNEAVSQYSIVEYDGIGEEPSGLKLYQHIDGSEITSNSYYLVQTDSVQATGELAGEADLNSLEVTGHSLGGHLAAAFTALFNPQVESAYTYNAPGFIESSINEAFFAELEGVPSGSASMPSDIAGKLTRVQANNAFPGEDQWEFISNLHGGTDGTLTQVAIEDRFGSANHSIKALTNSLAVYNLVAFLDGSWAVNDYNAILHSASHISDESLESIVNNIGDFFGLGTSISGDNREGLHARLAAIYEGVVNNPQDAPENWALKMQYQSTQIVDFSQMSLAPALFQEETSAGQGYRYALAQGLPFALLLDDYSGTAAAGSLYDVEQFSDEFIFDRINYLEANIESNSSDSLYLDEGWPSVYIDANSNKEIYTGTESSSLLPFTRYTFGLHSETSHDAGIGALLSSDDGLRDRMYGLAGNDTLDGKDGDDYLDGGSGDDSLTGGEGNDTLRGGTGTDRFYFSTSGDSFGVDVIKRDENDTSNSDRIVIDGETLEGELTRLSSDATYYTLEGDSDGTYKIALDQSANLLSISVKDTEDKVDVVRIEGWNESTNNFGFTLANNASLEEAPDTSNDDFDVAEATMGFFADATYDADLGRPVISSNDWRERMFTETNHTGLKYIAEDIRSEWRAGSDTYPYESNGEPIDLNELSVSDYEQIILDLSDTSQEANDLLDALDNANIDPALWNTPLNDLQGYGTTYDGRYLFDGSNGRDWLSGTLFKDMLKGYGGNDLIYGDGDPFDPNRQTENGGEDLLQGGLGNDSIWGGGGADMIWGFLAGGTEGETKYPIYGDVSTDKDTLLGEQGDDFVSGSNAKDFVSGGSGKDKLFGDDNADRLDGGDGDDIIMGDSAWSVTLNIGDYFRYVEDAPDPFFNQSVMKGDSIHFNNGEEASLSKDDVIYAGDGNDTVWGEAGADLLVAGNGSDLVFGDRASDSFYNTIGGSPLHGYEGIISFDRLFLGESSAGPVFQEAEAPLDIDQHGDDVLEGGEGDDGLVGQGGNDILKGGAGNDILLGDDTILKALSESVQGAHGEDSLYGNEGNDTLLAHGGDDYIDGGSGSDLIQAGAGNDFAISSSGSNTLYGEQGNDTLHGGSGIDFLSGDALYNDPVGEAGDDYLIGEGGNDYLEGGEGNDTYDGGKGVDYIEDLGGDDTYFFSSGDGPADSSGSREAIHDEGGADRIIFSSDITRNDLRVYEQTNEFLRIDYSGGNSSDVVLVDKSRLDFVLEFGGGSMTVADVLANKGEELSSDQSGGFLSGGDYNDTILGDAGDDMLAGGPGDDSLVAGAGDDSLLGGAGSDILVFGSGNDSLFGGEGSDAYQVSANVDQSLAINFSRASVGEDYIDLTGLGVSYDGGLNISGTDIEITLAPSGEVLFLHDVITDQNELKISGIRFSDIDATKDYLEKRLFEGFFDETLAGDAGGVVANDVIQSGSANNSVLMGHSGQDSLSGNDGADYLFGGSGDDVLTDAFPSNDVLDGGAGNDTLLAGEGSDIYRFGFGDGNDVIDNSSALSSSDNDIVEFKYYVRPEDVNFYREGFDLVAMLSSGESVTVQSHFLDQNLVYDSRVGISGFRFSDGTELDRSAIELSFGPDGDDTLIGTPLSDSLFGGAGNDLLEGLGENDFLYGGPGLDTLRGATGDDFLSGGDGADRLQGGDGQDQASGDSGDDVMWGGSAADTLWGGSGHDTIEGDAGIDTLFGGLGDDILEGDQDGDFLYGEDGADTLRGATGNDVLSGGAGNDRFQAGSGADEVDGGSGNDVMWGGDGNDTLWGGLGYDTLEGDAGADTLFGGLGNDILEGDQDNDVLYGEDGEDTLRGSSGNDALFGGAGDDRFQAGLGADEVDGGSGNDVMWGGEGNDTLWGGSDNDTLEGDEGFDTLFGGTGDDLLKGKQGNDFLYGEGGDDTVRGTTGDDWLSGGDGADRLQGGDGQDELHGDSGHDVMWGDDHDDILYGGLGLDTLQGDSGSDTLYGGDDDDLLMGDQDNDSLYGEAGADVLRGAAGDDFLSGGLGDDRFNAGSGQDVVNGGAGDDVMWGGLGNDTLNGGLNNDTLEGDAGNDELFGMSGSDLYRYAEGDGTDTISDQGLSSDTDTLSVDGGLALTSHEQLWFSQGGDGNDLVIDFLDGNAGDQLIVSDWFASDTTGKQLESIEFGASWSISNTEAGTADPLDQLVQAMAGVSMPTSLNDLQTNSTYDDVRSAIDDQWVSLPQ